MAVARANKRAFRIEAALEVGLFTSRYGIKVNGNFRLAEQRYLII